MAIKRIDLGWISVSDINKSRKFFTETLGLEETGFTPENNWLELQGKEGGMLLGVGQTDDEEAAQSGMNAVLTLTVDNIEETINNLKAKGVEFIDEMMEIPGHVKMITFTDFDGNMFQLVEQLNNDQDEECDDEECGESCC